MEKLEIKLIDRKVAKEKLTDGQSKPLGIDKAVCIAAPLILMAATQVGAIEATVVIWIHSTISKGLNCCMIKKIIAFIKWLFPAPATSVTNRLMGSTFSGFKQFIFSIVFLHHDEAMLYADLCFHLVS